MRKSMSFVLLIFSLIAKGATVTDSLPVRLNFFSTLGLGMMDNTFSPVTGNSIQTSTGVEAGILRHSGLGAILGFDSYDYHTAGTTYNLNGTLKLTSLAAYYRYIFGNGGFRPYLKAGGGGVWLTVPTVSTGSGLTNVQKQTQFVGLVLGEAGFQFHAFRKYYLMLSAERDWMANASLLNASLRTTTFKIGLLSSL